MKTIHKYELPVQGALIEMPLGAVVLDCQAQNEMLQLWAVVDVDTDHNAFVSELRRFEVFGTGHPIAVERAYRHIGTVQVHTFVWHVFEDIGSSGVVAT